MDIDGRMPKDLTDRIDRSDMVKVTVREENLLDREAPGPDRVRDLIGRGVEMAGAAPGSIRNPCFVSGSISR